MILPPKINAQVSEYYVEPVVTDGGWLAKPEVPTAEEVLDLYDDDISSPDVVELPTNRVKGAWESKEEYLSAQYLLNREDSVRGLREAVTNIRLDPDKTEDFFDGKFGIYEKVAVTKGFDCPTHTDTNSGAHLWHHGISSWSGSQDHLQHEACW